MVEATTSGPCAKNIKEDCHTKGTERVLVNYAPRGGTGHRSPTSTVRIVNSEQAPRHPHKASKVPPRSELVTTRCANETTPCIHSSRGTGPGVASNNNGNNVGNAFRSTTGSPLVNTSGMEAGHANSKTKCCVAKDKMAGNFPIVGAPLTIQREFGRGSYCAWRNSALLTVYVPAQKCHFTIYFSKHSTSLPSKFINRVPTPTPKRPCVPSISPSTVGWHSNIVTLHYCH